MKTEKRAAKVGEEIIITNTIGAGDDYEKGTILTVYDVDSRAVETVEEAKGWGTRGGTAPMIIWHEEYEVIIDE